jgi:hypothetical protein
VLCVRSLCIMYYTVYCVLCAPAPALQLQLRCVCVCVRGVARGGVFGVLFLAFVSTCVVDVGSVRLAFLFFVLG